MTSFLSTISGQFAKNILLGTFFPVVLFVIAITAVALPLADVTPQVVFTRLFPWEQDSTLPALTVFVLVATVLLFALNIPLIRLYEGYPWRDSWMGGWCTGRQRRRCAAAYRVFSRARLLTRQAREAAVSQDLPVGFPNLLDRAGKATRSLPDDLDLVLPTRLGNVIRAFEGYPTLKYGIDAVVVWPRLAQKLPKEASEGIDSAKSSFDFMLNCSVLSTVVAATVAAAGLIRHHPFDWPAAAGWLPWTGFFALLSYLFYLGAINRAGSWGLEFKVAFDLYRLQLLSGLGYQVEVSGPKQERALWEEISYQLFYPDAKNLTQIPYKAGQTTLVVKPSSVVVTAERSVSWDATKNAFVVVLEIQNADAFRGSAESIEVTDKVAKYLRVTGDPVSATGPGPLTWKVRSLDPLVVAISSLQAGEKATVTYNLRKA